MLPPVQTKAEVIERLQQQLRAAAAAGVALGLFGSFVRDEAGPDSDVGLLAELEDKALTLNGYFAAVNFLEALLGRLVEVLTPDSLLRHIGPHILPEVALFYRKLFCCAVRPHPVL